MFDNLNINDINNIIYILENTFYSSKSLKDNRISYLPRFRVFNSKSSMFNFSTFSINEDNDLLIKSEKKSKLNKGKSNYYTNVNTNRNLLIRSNDNRNILVSGNSNYTGIYSDISIKKEELSDILYLVNSITVDNKIFNDLISTLNKDDTNKIGEHFILFCNGDEIVNDIIIKDDLVYIIDSIIFNRQYYGEYITKYKGIRFIRDKGFIAMLTANEDTLTSFDLNFII
jgi:hypothetical protein